MSAGADDRLETDGCKRNSAALTIRLARPDDEDRILAWRNDPFIVARTTTQRQIDAKEHRLWYRAALNDARRRIQIIEVAGQPAGSLRFDKIEEGTCIISVCLTEAFTGHGYGPQAISQASVEVIRDWNVDVIACVRADNLAGAKAFFRAGYQETMGRSYCPPDHRIFVLSLSNVSEIDVR